MKGQLKSEHTQQLPAQDEGDRGVSQKEMMRQEPKRAVNYLGFGDPTLHHLHRDKRDKADGFGLCTAHK